MPIQLGSAYGKVALDVTGLMSGITKGKTGLLSLAQVGKQVGESLTNLGNKMTIGLTLPIAAMGAASIKAASSFEETKNKAKVVFEDMANSVIANADKSAKALGIGKQKYLDYASSIGAALKAGGLGIQEATDLSEKAVKHMADLVSFHDSNIQDVSAAWQSAIRGQYEPIQRYFPFITNEFLKTYGTANNLIDANTQQLTANQRAIILNAIAFDEKLNPALDDFSETSGSLANQMRTTNELFNDSLIMLGQNLLPIALKLVTALNDLLVKFNEMSPAQQKMLLGFAGLLAIMGPVLKVIASIVTIASSFSGLAGTLSALGISLAGIGTAVSAIGAGIAALAVPVLVVIALLVALALQFYLVYLAFKNNFLGIRDGWNALITFLKNAWKALTSFLKGDTEAAGEYLKAAFTAITDHINNVFQKVFGIRDAWGQFTAFLRNALEGVVTFISNAFTRTNWSQLGKYVLYGIANGMLLGIPTLVSVALRSADAALAAIKSRLGIRSPSKAFEQLGMYSAQGFQLGLARAMSADDIARTMARPANQMNNSQQQVINNNFSSGLTLREVHAVVLEHQDQLLKMMIQSLGG